MNLNSIVSYSNSIQIQLKRNGMQIGVEGIEIYLWLWCWNKHNVKKHDFEKTHFYSSLFGTRLNIFLLWNYQKDDLWNLKLFLPKLVLLNHHHWIYFIWIFHFHHTRRNPTGTFHPCTFKTHTSFSFFVDMQKVVYLITKTNNKKQTSKDPKPCAK